MAPSGNVKHEFKRWLLAHQWIPVVALISVVVGYVYLSSPRHTAELLPHGKVAFYQRGILSTDKHELIQEQGRWLIFGGEPFMYRELLVPFECRYNDSRNLRFENGGRVYMIDKKDQTREELRVVGGEWSYDASDHWQSIFEAQNGR